MGGCVAISARVPDITLMQKEGKEEGRGGTYLEQLLITIDGVLEPGEGHGHVVTRDGASSLGVKEEAGTVRRHLKEGRQKRGKEGVSHD